MAERSVSLIVSFLVAAVFLSIISIVRFERRRPPLVEQSFEGTVTRVKIEEFRKSSSALVSFTVKKVAGGFWTARSKVTISNDGMDAAERRRLESMVGQNVRMIVQGEEILQLQTQ